MILDDLYEGKLNPKEQAVPQDERYAALMKQFMEQMGRLEQLLNQEQMEMVMQMYSTACDLFSCEMQEKFVNGFTMGAKVMQICGLQPITHA